ncbi:MAG: ATP-dependent DNA helicase, partial [Ideonella sp.]|nr:ATP-dependent DNA helicase [Ideonella sp.]
EVSTRWADRAASVAPIVALIAEQHAQAPGNYLAFFSSFDYLQQAADALAEAHPAIPQWRQSRAMDEAAREAFLARFRHDGQGIGFAVLGGAFGEGIDLPGRRLVGAFVATLGMPAWNAVNDQVKARLDTHFGDDRGHDYTYLFPGVQKVVQAAGRVIRTADDRGVVWLIDDRYRRPKVRRLLPSWWGLGRLQ